MCGIAGIVDLVGEREIPESPLDRMVKALAHRGPDGGGVYRVPGLAFGHRRLAIVDPDQAAQPYIGSEGSVLTYNGEIYNHGELRGDLDRARRPIKTRSDTEILCELMELRGEDALPSLDGMFAFAHWTPRTETLLLVRDRIGEKPLYLAQTPDNFLIFASEIDAILESGLISAEINPTAVADYLLYGYVPDPKTIYRGIGKLPPGHLLKIARGQPIAPAKPWWTLTFKPDDGCLYEAVVEELPLLLDRCVSAQMMSDVPIGAFLSGGLDSGAVTASMQKAATAPVTTCAMGFADPDFDERAAARETATHLCTNHFDWEAPLSPVEDVPRLAAIYGEPFADSSALPTAHLCAGARRHATVALSGDGGDEVFAGYDRYGGILNEARLRQAIPGVVRRSIVTKAGNAFPAFTDRVPKPLRLRTVLQSVGEDHAAAYARAVSAVLPDLSRTLLSEELRDYRPEHHVEEAVYKADTDDPILSAQAADFATWLPGRMLVKIDRASMAVGLEVRPPLLDHRLVEWAARLPRRIKYSEGKGKVILREAIGDRLPKGVSTRAKKGFGSPVDHWFRDQDGSLSRHLLDRTAWRECGFFDQSAVEDLVARHCAGRRNAGQALWSILMFDAFLIRKPSDRTSIASY
ncbi:Asparagine synthase, glutamine-hydrolyzing [Parvularcula bermudensis HTCC2503]|uniref:asparagine synthase (glutamine-hydrolyzing) n=1 Tax=Parvularcula bermudensis (strain ATCC BAA-594 / HTCC2503 / KCTC 12087) TaxID=314260 RepID=E0TGP5_PARBH|nr:asparagine synthase (glutamine-hydrolyzing) [Parvularcula bermudensis]ADM10654.1 Asparagine synthase, glutamine-hydrolyzing [Parvularcula bermudensis HTCC2503]